MKKIYMFVMFVFFLATWASSNANAQTNTTNTFDQTATWASPTRDTGVPLGQILAELSAKYKFYWQLALATNQSVLDTQVAAEFKPQPLGQLLNKLFSHLNTPVSFDGKLLIVGAETTTLTTTQAHAAEQPTSGVEPAADRMVADPSSEDDQSITYDAAYASPQVIYGDAAYTGQPNMVVQQPARLNRGLISGRYSMHWYGNNPGGRPGYMYTTIGTQPRVYNAAGYGGRVYLNNARYGYGTGYASNYGYGYPYAGSPDQMYRQYFRDPRHLQTHGLLKINGPEYYLDKVRILVDGADINTASDVNNWHEQPIALPAGVRTITFIREDKGKTYRLERKVRILAAAPQLSLTGKLKPVELKLTRNEFENAEGTTLTQTQPVR